MSGKMGMKRNPGNNTARARMWKVMRRRLVFTLDNLVVPLDGVTSENAWKVISNLTRHGIVRFDRWSGKQGLPGSCKVYRLVYNPGPLLPTICPTCNQPITAKVCEVKP